MKPTLTSLAVAAENEILEADPIAEGAFLTDAGDLEGDLLRAEDELKSQAHETETLATAMENLDGYMASLESLIQNKSGTQITLDLLVGGVNNELSRLGESLSIPALESEDTDITQRHQLALEGIREWWHRAATAWVIVHKQQHDFFDDLLDTIEERLTKYTRRLSIAETEYKHKRPTWHQSSHTGNLLEMWYHFNTDHGDVHDLANMVEKDVEMSTYVLVTYPKKVEDIYKQAISALKSNKVTDLRTVITLGKAMGQQHHPADAFEKRFIGGKPFLSVTGLEYETGSLRKVTVLDGNKFENLAYLATPKKVQETGSWRHLGKKLLHNVVGSSHNVWNGNMDITFHTDDIGTILDAGFQYGKNIDTYILVSRDFRHVGMSADTVFEKMAQAMSESNTPRAAAAVVRQVQQYLTNIESCFRSPAIQEMSRSIKGMRYCDYMARRMIYQAR